MRTTLQALTLTLIAAFCATWAIWTEYRVVGLETRLNVMESENHWTETPSPKEAKR